MTNALSKQNDRTNRPRHTERLVLTCLRRVGAASKPDLARQVSLTPQAIHGIVDGLLNTGLVEAGGRRGGMVGHPSTLYSIRPSGAYAIGVEIGARRVETTLINFAAQMVYRGQGVYPNLDATNVAEAAATAFDSVLVHARASGIDQARIIGTGIVTTTDMTKFGSPIREALATRINRDGLGMPFYLEREVVARALSMSILAATPMPPSCLLLSVGATVDGCLMQDGMVRGGTARHRNLIRFVPISSTQVVGDVVGFENLAYRLGSEPDLDLSTETFFRATQSNQTALEAWLDDSADALAMAIAAAHSFNDLGGVFIRVAPPNSIGDSVVERVRQRLLLRSKNGIDYPPVYRDQGATGSAAMSAATMVLFEQFDPNGSPRSPVGSVAFVVKAKRNKSQEI